MADHDVRISKRYYRAILDEMGGPQAALSSSLSRYRSIPWMKEYPKRQIIKATRIVN
jgi:hypothetical protein